MHSLSDLIADFIVLFAGHHSQKDAASSPVELRTRKMGDLIVVYAHLEADATLSVEAGHDIAVAARERVLQRHRVLNLMTHIDPFRRPDLDH